MTRWTAEDVRAVEARRLKQQDVAKPSKYRNVKVVVDGEKFDSKREAAYWQQLKVRERIGEIQGLERQVPFDLLCPYLQGSGDNRVVATYIADFTYRTFGPETWNPDGDLHVVDAKGRRTALYALKKKWLELQDGIVIEEV